MLAAAIRPDSEVIVTYNLADFPRGSLAEFDIEALHPDEFLSDLFDLNHALVLEAVRMQRSHLRNLPPSLQTNFCKASCNWACLK